MQSILKPLQLEQPELAPSRRKVVSSTQTGRKSLAAPSQFTLLKQIQWKAYLVHLPVLFLGLISYAAVVFILGWVEPRSIQHLLVPNSYAVLLLAAAAGHFFCGSYFFLNTRRGFLLSLTLTAVLFLKLQQVLTPQLVLFTVLACLAIEAFYLLCVHLFSKLGLQINLPTLPKFRHKEIPTDLAPLPEDLHKSQITASKPRPRKHGRPRKHRFFGK